MGAVVGSSHDVSVAPFLSRTGLLTLFPFSTVGSFPWQAVLHELRQYEFFAQAAVLQKLLQHVFLSWGAVFQEQAAPV